MKTEAERFVARAEKALALARAALPISLDGAASRAYYAAFYAVSAVFAEQGRFFKRHGGVHDAMHAELIRNGQWRVELGEDYRERQAARHLADYGTDRRIDREAAELAIERAERILNAARETLRGHDG